MKSLRYVILAALLLVVFTAFGTMVLWIFQQLLGSSFENLLYTGFKVGFLAWILFLAEAYWQKRKHG